MIATLALASALVATPTLDGTRFAHRFVKDELQTYTLDVAGGSDMGEMKIACEFELKAMETKDGKTSFSLKVVKASAIAGGQDMPMDGASEFALTRDKFGVPTVVEFEGLQAIYYVALMTCYLPDAELAKGGAFKGEFDMKGAKYATEGTYAEDVKEGEATLAVLSSKGALTPEGEEPAGMKTKAYFDLKSGKVVRTESVIDTPDGEFKMVVTLKKPA